MFEPLKNKIDTIFDDVLNYSIDTSFKDEIPTYEACKEAVYALREGNYGIGAVILDNDGAILAKNHNRLFEKNARSDYHAEMLVINDYETTYKKDFPPNLTTIYTTVEPCPMCFTRILSSNIGRVKYLLDDEIGGALKHIESLPLAWKNNANKIVIEKIKCSSGLKKLCEQAAELSITMRLINKQSILEKS